MSTPTLPVTAGSLSRRGFFRVAAGAGVLAGLPIMSESRLALAQMPTFAPSGKGIHIDANENPMGPCQSALDAMLKILPRGGRYLFDVQAELQQAFAASVGLPTEMVEMYAGSSAPLHYAILALTGPGRPVVTADPGYEAPAWAARQSGAEVIRVPLADPHGAARHDLRTMATASSSPGVIYVCNPNNPTGTVTPHDEIEWLVRNAPKGATVMVDEAYIHLCGEESAVRFLKQGRDVIVLRTFSKLYGMAGLRLGAVMARPETLKRIAGFAGMDSLPVTAMAAGKACLADTTVVPERRERIAAIRTENIAWLRQKGFACTPSVSNCFMLDLGKPADPTRKALAAREVFVGREWKSWPNHMRITVGTAEEMAGFRHALTEVLG